MIPRRLVPNLPRKCGGSAFGANASHYDVPREIKRTRRTTGGSTSTARVRARIYHMFQSFDPPHFPLERRPAHPLWFEENIINAPILVFQGRPQSLKLIHGPMERRAALRRVCEPVSLPRCEDGSARRQVELQGSALRQRTDKPPSSTPEGLWGSG